MQFRALSYARWGNAEQYPQVRETVVAYMRENLADFDGFFDDPADTYFSNMAEDKGWGDELTLVRPLKQFSRLSLQIW